MQDSFEVITERLRQSDRKDRIADIVISVTVTLIAIGIMELLVNHSQFGQYLKY